jgi:ABC-type phosphate transport system substrate-binding protein
MKRFIFVFTLMLAFAFAEAQTVNDVPIKDIDVDYIQIVGSSSGFSKKVSIEVDFGQESSFFESRTNHAIKDENGKMIKFNSMIDALNFFSQNGFDFVQAYAFSVSNQTVYHYLLRKRKAE